ncbi:MAG: DarT ssDNA thymidine ADP-ribosyltransferase family protein [Thermoleophilia bacterium]
MTSPPPQPRIYHITHVENLPSILANGGILSDSAMAERDSPATVIGMSTIKTRRLALPVKCHPGDHVADHVPFLIMCPSTSAPVRSCCSLFTAATIPN